ncbi:hypothetical protein XENOCAPTIV_015450 [Xenoophorus captivus]|uniref:Uncharacterized protein n=1 Tax=Xenoophorus captivus TaxID=1517983 RepID=A0ABV0RCI0_9TELE
MGGKFGLIMTKNPLIITGLVIIMLCKSKQDETKRRAIGSFLAARDSGRFSRDEANHCSQCLAKFLILANRLTTTCNVTIHLSLSSKSLEK